MGTRQVCSVIMNILLKYNLNSALKAKEKGKLHQWVLGYLNSEGNNKKLGKVLKEEKYIWSDLIEYPLDKLKRVMGYEKDMIFRENRDKWEKRILYFTKCLKRGESFTPLISSDYWGEIHLADGTHRFEALKKSGFNKYWTIFYIKEENNKQEVLDSASLV